MTLHRNRAGFRDQHVRPRTKINLQTTTSLGMESLENLNDLFIRELRDLYARARLC